LVARILLGSTNAPAYDGCCGLIVDPLNGASTGVGGNQWITLSITTNSGTSRISINGQTVIVGPSIGAADDTGLTGGTAPGGKASFSYADVFTSVASPGDSQFGIFDNFKVEECNTSGDLNCDGKVDGEDFLLWQRDPDVGSLADWEANYGTSAPLSATSTAVPEPATAIMLMLGAALLFRSKGQRPPQD
jgi:hypothetical protein